MFPSYLVVDGVLLLLKRKQKNQQQQTKMNKIQSIRQFYPNMVKCKAAAKLSKKQFDDGINLPANTRWQQNNNVCVMAVCCCLKKRAEM